MEFLALFFTITALAFVLWLMTIVVLFLIKVTIGTTGVLYYSIKGLADFLQRLLGKIAKILHIDSFLSNLNIGKQYKELSFSAKDLLALFFFYIFATEEKKLL